MSNGFSQTLRWAFWPQLYCDIRGAYARDTHWRNGVPNCPCNSNSLIYTAAFLDVPTQQFLDRRKLITGISSWGGSRYGRLRKINETHQDGPCVDPVHLRAQYAFDPWFLSIPRFSTHHSWFFYLLSTRSSICISSTGTSQQCGIDFVGAGM